MWRKVSCVLRHNFLLLTNEASLFRNDVMMVLQSHRLRRPFYTGNSTSGSNPTFSHEDGARSRLRSMTKQSRSNGQEGGMMAVLVRKQRPLSPNFFTGRATFYDFLYDLDERLKILKEDAALKHIPIPSDQSYAKSMDWVTKDKIEEMLEISLKTREYRQIVERLQTLSLHTDASATFEDFLSHFRKDKKTVLSKIRKVEVDEYGRSSSIGKRKEASALVSLILGTGEVMVNGRPLYEYFPRVQDRQICIEPMELTDRLSKYNAWCVAKGGGHTGKKWSGTFPRSRFTQSYITWTRDRLSTFLWHLGQARAIQLGVSRSLCMQEPQLHPTLKQGKFFKAEYIPLLWYSLLDFLSY
jgi:small subunit ribosomal protein S9